MQGKFRMADDVHENDVDGMIRWICHPASTGARQLTVLEGTFAPGQGHSFHRHPTQEEVLFVLAGSVELWLGTEARTLAAGDALFIPPGAVHAAFNAGDGEARMLAMLGPSVGDGIEITDMSGEPPWSGLRR